MLFVAVGFTNMHENILQPNLTKIEQNRNRYQERNKKLRNARTREVSGVNEHVVVIYIPLFPRILSDLFFFFSILNSICDFLVSLIKFL